MRIGILDSGVGGLTLLAEALRVLPCEDFYYYADTDNVPYLQDSLRLGQRRRKVRAERRFANPALTVNSQFFHVPSLAQSKPFVYSSEWRVLSSIRHSKGISLVHHCLYIADSIIVVSIPQYAKTSFAF
jgi:hypothetical protein